MTKTAELLFDTNALVDIYRGQASIKAHFEAILDGSLLPYVSVITEGELWRGLRPDELERHELSVRSSETNFELYSLLNG
jgi:predicted nucleic acid-binding protein